MTRACDCDTCPGYYLGAHPCPCSCHRTCPHCGDRGQVYYPGDHIADCEVCGGLRWAESDADPPLAPEDPDAMDSPEKGTEDPLVEHGDVCDCWDCDGGAWSA